MTLGRKVLEFVFGPFISALAWALDQKDMWPCQIGIHVSRVTEIPGGKFAKFCPRCGNFEHLSCD